MAHIINNDFNLQKIVGDNVMLPSLEDLDEIGHAEDLRTILSGMTDMDVYYLPPAA